MLRQIPVLLSAVAMAAVILSGPLRPVAADESSPKPSPAGKPAEAEPVEAESSEAKPAAGETAAAGSAKENDEAWPFGAPTGGIRLSRTGRVWVDPKQHVVIIDGEICLRQGQLEMFACPKGTKDYESVVATYGKPSVVHAGLLAAGARVGHPVRFDPKYTPAAGTQIDVQVLWKDAGGKKHTAKAQQWIRNVRTERAMRHSWVFAGSGFWSDPETGRRYYHADGGDFICVSNFSTAMLDLPIPSSQENDELLYEAFTENIPALGTKVRLVLVPKLKKDRAKGESADKADAKKAAREEVKGR